MIDIIVIIYFPTITITQNHQNSLSAPSDFCTLVPTKDFGFIHTFVYVDSFLFVERCGSSHDNNEDNEMQLKVQETVI